MQSEDPLRFYFPLKEMRKNKSGNSHLNEYLSEFIESFFI